MYQIVPEFTRPGRRVYSDSISLFVALECPDCHGDGRVQCDAGVDGFQKLFSCACERCDGDGRIYEEVSEDDL